MGTAAVIGGIALGASAVGAVKQVKAGKEGERLAGENALAIEAETEEQIRRTEADQAQTMSLTKAMQGGSGVRSGAGTTQTYLDEMQKTFEGDIDWMRESGASQASIQRAEGSLVKKQATANAWGTVAQGTSSMLAFWK